MSADPRPNQGASTIANLLLARAASLAGLSLERGAARRHQVPGVALSPGQAHGARRRRSSPRCPCSSRAAGRGRAGPRAAPASRTRRRSSRFAATPPPSTTSAHPLALRRLDELARQHRRHGGLERRAHVGHPAPSSSGAAPRATQARHLRLDAREAHLERAARGHRRRELHARARRLSRARRSTTGPPG